MSINVVIIVGNFAYGNPASLGEPLGLWGGQADVTGDVTGGNLNVIYRPQNPSDTPTLADQRRQYVYFIDGASIEVTQGPGNLGLSVFAHMARSNSAIAAPYIHRIARPSLDKGGTLFVPNGEMMTNQLARLPLFWDTQELSAGANDLVVLHAENNVNLAIYRTRVYGRYYDRQVLSNRSFGRLVAPPPIAPFD